MVEAGIGTGRDEPERVEIGDVDDADGGHGSGSLAPARWPAASAGCRMMAARMPTAGPFDALMAFAGRRHGILRPADVTWAHAVNDRARLDRALADESIVAFEADVSISRDGTLVLAHPPATTSDLPFHALLDRVAASPRILKLDFKDPAAVGPALELVRRRDLLGPIVLNADVLAAAGAGRPGFEGPTFIETCRRLCPRALLSVGWTTTAASTYGAQEVDAMLQLCAPLGQVTFPVRARALPASIGEVSRLLGGEGRTLTVWDDAVPTPPLRRWLAATIDPTTAFVDLPREG